MTKILKAISLGILMVALPACGANTASGTPSFPRSQVPGEIEEEATAHLVDNLEEIYAPPSTYSFFSESIKLEGSQELILDDRDASNGILEQWCLVFSYEVQAGDPNRILLNHRVYQINKKSSGWFTIPIYNYSDEPNYWQYIADTWERCLGY